MYMYVGLAKIQSKGVHIPFNLLSWCIIYLSSSSGMHGTRREREREERDVQVRGYYFSRRIVAWTSFAFLCFIFMIWRGEGERLAVPERINFRGLWLRWNREQRRVSRPIASSRDFLGASTIVSRCSKGARGRIIWMTTICRRCGNGNAAYVRSEFFWAWPTSLSLSFCIFLYRIFANERVQSLGFDCKRMYFHVECWKTFLYFLMNPINRSFV